MKGYTGSTTSLSAKDCWQTPPKIFNYFNELFHFTLDTAASDSNHLCSNYYTEADNSLEQPWGSVNWCNPPYSDITPWVEKAILEKAKGNLSVMLIPADTSVQWFKTAFINCSSCILISGRISFINADTGKPVNGNNKGSVVFIFDPEQTEQEVQLIDRNELMGIN